ncbi:MAG: hypothetical protein IJW87_01835 [Clostridia bacterium]|nr:hypothetical protein [Clostridia bacterium]
MKKIIAMLMLSAMLVSFASCHADKTEDTSSTSPSMQETEQTESTASQTTYSEAQSTSEQTEHPGHTEKPSRPEKQIVGIGEGAFLELPSRILFSATLSPDTPVNDEFWGTSSDYLVYYSKADGEVYVNCFDPLCEHYGCSAVGSVRLGNSQFFIEDRFYEVSPLGEIESFSFDGTGRKKEFDADYGDYGRVPPWGRNRLAYDRYIYIDFLTEAEDYHTLRYDTKTQTMEDMTEKTGNYLLPLYAYDGEIYGRDANGLAVKTDLSLSYVQEVYEVYQTGGYDLSLGSKMIGVAKGKNTETGRMTETLGVQIYDLETEAYTLLTSEQIGHTVSRVIFADEDYYYFFAKESVYIGVSHQKTDVYNYTGGKIYRMKHDGTDCVCIYENANLRITDMYIYENTVFASACRLDVHAGIAQTWDYSVYIGTMDENGMIGSLAWVEVIS